MEPYPAADTKVQDLPEDVLYRIFSCLHMRDVARASASCSAFLRAWRRYPHLTFDVHTLHLQQPTSQRKRDDELLLQQEDELAGSFVRHVDAIMLRRHSEEALDALIVEFGYLRKQHAPCVDRWVRFALTLTTTRRLTLDFLPRGCYLHPDSLQYDFPCSLLSAGTPAAAALEHLYLRAGSLRPCIHSPQPGLINLATLVLETVSVTGEVLEHFLSSCHKLQSLKLKLCGNLAYLKVLPDRLKQLRFLVIKRCWSMRRIDVSGSPIKSLRFDGRNLLASMLHGSVLGSASKLTSATFNLKDLFWFKGTDNPHLPLLSLAHLMPGLERLSLTFVWEIKVVMTSPHSTGNRFRHLKNVHLTIDIRKRHGRDDFLFVYPLLDVAPALKVLSLDLKRFAPAMRRQHNEPAPAGGYFRKDLGLPHHSLKTVHITRFDADLASLELVLYILENARALRSLSLQPLGSSDKDKALGMGWRSRQVRKAIATFVAPAVPSGSRILKVKSHFKKKKK